MACTRLAHVLSRTIHVAHDTCCDAYDSDYSMHCTAHCTFDLAIASNKCLGGNAHSFAEGTFVLHLARQLVCVDPAHGPGQVILVQGTCAKLTIAGLIPSPSDPLLHPDMMGYTMYLGAFQNSTARAGPNALAFQGCPGIVATLHLPGEALPSCMSAMPQRCMYLGLVGDALVATS